MHRTLIAAFITLVAVGQARADTLEAFKKAIHTKVSAYRSMQYKIHMVTDMVNEQMSFRSTTDQTAEYTRQGEKALWRMEGKSETSQKFGETSQSTNMNSLDICDGATCYNMTDASGQKSATKRKYDPKAQPSPFDAMASFKVSEEHYNLKLLPDETVGGKPMYVLEMTLKDKQPGMPIGLTKLYYDKSTGIVMKSVSNDEAGKPVATMTTSDVKLDTNIPADHFVFKAPAGVEVVDQSAKSKPQD